ncbi:S4 domain protein YaaA [Bacillus oleivorans]|uniref:S4 domain protein YaaA n=1 Tax=Bacillus oleivorans TaxID=1448271 RepID=A0A285CI60_9BACI|nr:S4 domain-containing protein YaaA [Bacillus oleivorans]SNX66696.1 S4 domain protein YaaA [Bacillus oleivorans]
MQSIQIETEYVTLGQFLKMIDVIGSGGLAKWYLEEYQVYVNGEIEQRRGRKLKPGDQIEIPDVGKFEIIE